jgi:hypothetical protein
MGYFAFLGYFVILGFWLHFRFQVAFCAFGCKMKTLRIRQLTAPAATDCPCGNRLPLRQQTAPAAGRFGKEDRPGDE